MGKSERGTRVGAMRLIIFLTGELSSLVYKLKSLHNIDTAL